MLLASIVCMSVVARPYKRNGFLQSWVLILNTLIASDSPTLAVSLCVMNPEKATDYLSRVNWKSLVEWLTAEAILNRPIDPVQFCRDLLGERLADQATAEFKPDQITDWLRNCYTEATALVDEHGVIQGKTLERAQQSLPEQVSELKRKVEGMQKLLDASSTIATLDPLQATDNIVAETCRILNCDRATIFTVDKVTQELVLCVAEGAKNIRVPIGQVWFGCATWCIAYLL